MAVTIIRPAARRLEKTINKPGNGRSGNLEARRGFSLTAGGDTAAFCRLAPDWI
jgi:hypothetical protein